MKTFLLIIPLFVFSPGNLGKIAKINELKDKAEQAYIAGNYQVAIESYSKLFQDYQVEDEDAALNLSNAYYQLKQKDKATENYQKLASAKNTTVASIAANQLGVMAHENQKIEEALLYFKRALKANPANEEARYNYEMLKKIQQKNKSEDKSKKEKSDEEQKKQEPSQFAKQLKRQAEALAEQRRYREALQLMVEGMAQDPTVEQFSDFTQRLKDITEITGSIK